MSEPILSVRALDVVRGERRLITRLDLSLDGGEALAISGPSGCGKSSLLRVLAGLDAQASGEIRLRGRLPAEMDWTRYRRAVQHAPAVPALHGETVQAALARAFDFAIDRGELDGDLVRDLLTRAGLSPDVLTQRPDTLSTGQRLRVALVRTVLVRPDVLLLDEPTAALDEDARNAIESILADELTRGVAVVIVTHDGAQASRLRARRLQLTATDHAHA